MAEPSMLKFDFRELAEILVKHQGIHDGLWCIYLKFGINAANMGMNDQQVLPTAIVPVLEMGLQKASKVSNLTVDAATVNPPAKKTARKTK